MNKLHHWVPALVAPVVIVGAAIAAPAIASAAAPLSAKSPQQVLELVAKSATAAYSGTVKQSSDLGLPDLSALQNQGGIAGASGNELVDLLTASHTAKVYSDGGSKQRLQVLDTLAERDVVRNGDTVWLYDSSQKQATKLNIAGTRSGAKSASPSPTASSAPTPSSAPTITPAQLAAELVAQLKPSTDFAVSTQDRVAGRAVYRLTLTPKATDTLVKDATLAVDASTGVPLEVSVYAKGQAKPAESIAFSSIDYGKPAASVFDFTPPKGTKVETGGVQHHSGTKTHSQSTKPTVIGSGWDAIVELPAGSADVSALGSSTPPSSGTGSSSSGSSPGGADAQALLGLLQSVPGGRGAQTSLVSVLITNDGRVLAGAVPLSALEAAAQ